MRHLIALLLIMTVWAASGNSFAQDEEEGFVVKMLKKWTKEEKPSVTEEQKPKEMVQEQAGEAEETGQVEEGMPIEIEGERPAIADLSEKDIVERLVNLLKYHPDALNLIPELRSGEDEEGNLFYTYTPEDGITKNLDELEREKLMKVYSRVTSEVNRLNTEKIMRQLEQIRQAQQASRVPAQPPKVYQPPRR